MKKKDKSDFSSNKKRDGNLYDKIFKESLLDIFVQISEKHLGFKIKKSTHLPEKQQTTLERETDFMLLVETWDGRKFILHLEFQTKNNSEMVYRIGEYHGMYLRTYQLEIKHIVFYLGEKKSTMRSELKPNEKYEGFQLINICEFDYAQSLSSQIPEEIILTILSNFPKENAEEVIQLILIKLKRVCQNPNDLSKYIKQLIILSRLRKLENITKKFSNAMPILYDVETDGLYLEGIEKGIEKGIELEAQKSKAIHVQAVLALFEVGYNKDKIAERLSLPLKEISQILKENL